MRSTNLFWILSGSSIQFLEQSYPDHNKYKNLGAAILFTGLFAFISAIFVLLYLTDNWFILIPIAVLWASTVINIDMLFVNTMIKYEKSSLRSIFGVSLRILLGLIIAIIVSIPIEMKILEDEIRDEINRHDREKISGQLKVILDFSELDSLNKKKQKLEQLLLDEMMGKSKGSGRTGYGPIAKNIEKRINIVDTEIIKMKSIKDSTTAIMSQKINEEYEKNNKYGFLASFRSLYRLQNNSSDKSVNYIIWGIRIFFFLIELLPIVSKVLMSRGAYDSKYEFEEYEIIHINDKNRHQIK